jgi:hypothetical protein
MWLVMAGSKPVAIYPDQAAATAFGAYLTAGGLHAAISIHFVSTCGSSDAATCDLYLQNSGQMLSQVIAVLDAVIE